VQADEGEECDDGQANNTGGYGKCSSTCEQGPRCGDGTLQAAEGEQCDGEDNCENSCLLTPCPNNGVRCDDVCINPNNNNEYCGASGNCEGNNAGEECGADDICQEGECAFGGDLPKINSFVVADAALPGDGGSTTLSWSVSDAASLSISAGVGTVTGTSKSVTVEETTTFTLTATNPGGSVEAEVTVEVKTLGVVQWQAQLGSDQIDNGVGVGIDGSGNVILGGSAGGDIDGVVGGTDGFLVKYSVSGSETWRTQFGTDTEDSVEGIAVASNGTSYAYGITYGTFEDNMRQGRWDAYVAKFNADGTMAWVRQFGTASDEYVYGGALASDGGVLIVGHTYGAYDGAIAGVGADAFVAKYSASGELVWKDQFGVDNDDSAKAVACDATGSVFVTGTTEGVLETGKNNLGLSDAFITRYSSAGVRDWTRQFGTVEYEEPYGIVADANGNPAVVGYTAGALDGSQLGGAGDVFIVSYSSTGTLTWKDQFGTNKWDGATAVVPDPDGSLYIIGETTGDLDGFVNGGRDGFVTKYSSSGVKQWLSTFGGAGQDDTRDAAYAGGIIAIAGWTDGEMGGTQQGVVDAYVTTIE
jgi:hypothetical protein